MKQYLLTLVLPVAMALPAAAQSEGGISADMLKSIRSSYQPTTADKALRTALASSDISKLAANPNNPAAGDTYFSHRVHSKGITNQLSSGRCWLFTGTNVLRAKMIARYGLGAFQFSHNYSYFWDQLEKSNLFLQGIIDNADKPMDSQMVEWLFKNPLSDGGQFTGVSDIISKYGLVPKEAMPETYSSNNTSQMANLLKLKLRQFGLELRELAADKKKKATIPARKTEMLATIYRMLAQCLGEPPAEFTWTRRNAAGKPVETKTYTPKEFYDTFVGENLTDNYVMLMNDPTRPYYQCFEIDMDRHVYDGRNWTYVNLPIEEIKKVAIRSIKDSTMMYFSCDVGKFLDRQAGLLDEANFDYASLMGTDFPMDKKQRVQTFASGSSHAMTLMAVDLDETGKPRKWMVENSWGPSSGFQGHLIMTDKWFDEYMFRLVAERQYVDQNILDVLKKKPIRLPAWDPMFADEQ